MGARYYLGNVFEILGIRGRNEIEQAREAFYIPELKVIGVRKEWLGATNTVSASIVRIAYNHLFKRTIARYFGY